MSVEPDGEAASHRPRRPFVARVLLVLSVGAILVQLFGLYRPGGPPQALVLPGSDKAMHVLGFSVPVLLVLLAAGARAPLRRGFVVGVVGVFAVHAVLSEVVQGSLYRYRTGDPYDVLADWVGLGLGWLGWRASARGGS